jgi:hypothetical protein
MAAPSQWTPKVNRHVSYRTSGGRRRPAVITGIVSGTTVNLRVGHHAAPETYASVTYGKGATHYLPQ